MSTVFHGFELDEARRELRLSGKEVTLQPVVFDLLAYLVAQRDRVVSKDELLEQIWPDVIVTDASVQRAVSLIRSVFREHGFGGEIRTYARRGYRFCAEPAVPSDEVTEWAEEEAVREPDPGQIEEAHADFAAGNWHGVIELLEEAALRAPLGALDFEIWGAAAHRSGQLDRAVEPLERAVAAAVASGERACAARCATLLADVHFERRQPAVAQGWLQRAKRMLDGLDGTYEEGLYSYFASRFALFQGKLEEAAELGQRALWIGRNLGNVDLEALGLQYSGLALSGLGKVRDGASLQDESATLVLGGGVSPWAGGLVFCGVIWGAMDRGDWGRASEWADHFSRWCDRTGSSAFPGLCRLHTADVLNVRGELARAEEIVMESIEYLRTMSPWAEGDAWRVLGEIRVMRGDRPAAEAAFEESHRLGWDPQPAYALLLMVQGKSDAAVRALERALDDTCFPQAQRRGILLAHMVPVALAAGDYQRASRALRELDAHPEIWEQPPIAAMVCRARAEMLAHEGDLWGALTEVRRSARAWADMGFVLREAEARLKMVELLRRDGDLEAARLELRAAEALLERSSAKALIEQAASTRLLLAQDASGDRQA